MAGLSRGTNPEAGPDEGRLAKEPAAGDIAACPIAFRIATRPSLAACGET
jgi:hypothetical protein